jgi:hypothetical protein
MWKIEGGVVMASNSNRMNKVNEELKKEISIVISQEL